MQKRIYQLLLVFAMIGICIIMAGKEKEYIRLKVSENIKAVSDGLGNIVLSESERDLVNHNPTEHNGLLEEQMENDRQEQCNGTEEMEEGILGYRVGTTEVSYFDDVLFIGDSRTVGIKEYGYFDNADYFADVSMSVYKVNDKKLAVEGRKKTGLQELLASKKYGKIYIMLGINELGYDFEYTVEKYQALIESIQEAQPDAIIYICANLHVTEKQSSSDRYFNNENINRFNLAISQLANGENCFYIDVNVLFDDENGNLSREYCSDEVHVKGKYYAAWCDWLLTQAVVYL